MTDFIVTFGLTRLLRDEADEELARRRHALYMATFKLGSAWQGAQSAIFLSSDLAIEDVMARLKAHLDRTDFLLVVRLGESGAALFSGDPGDDEAFEARFPQAICVD